MRILQRRTQFLPQFLWVWHDISLGFNPNLVFFLTVLPVSEFLVLVSCAVLFTPQNCSHRDSVHVVELFTSWLLFKSILVLFSISPVSCFFFSCDFFLTSCLLKIMMSSLFVLMERTTPPGHSSSRSLSKARALGLCWRNWFFSWQNYAQGGTCQMGG